MNVFKKVLLFLKVTSLNTSSEVTLFDNNAMPIINKLKNQRKRADLARIYNELKKLEVLSYCNWIWTHNRDLAKLAPFSQTIRA